MILNLKKSGSELCLPSHDGDAGYDLVANSSPNIVGKKDEFSGYWEEISYIEYDTNVFVQPLQEVNGEPEPLENIYYSLVYPRSSLSKYNLILANHVGVIDSGYQNSIKLRFKYIAQPKDFIIGFANQIFVKIDESKIYHKDDKIGQLIFAKHIHPSQINKVESFEESSRGLGGFGSTGK